MFLQLAHTKLDVFTLSKTLTPECYKVTRLFPPDERFALSMQIRRAAVSVHLNLAEGCSRKSFSERKRFFEVARGSVTEIDMAMDIAVGLQYCTPEDLESLGEALVRVFKMLSALINSEHPTHA